MVTPFVARDLSPLTPAPWVIVLGADVGVLRQWRVFSPLICRGCRRC
ncbi:hypothetical protein KCP76_11295 [Salmonella enterica subsp. enterica serovar Weltevreden]|nr:hypothetical protein KCP76_11295 [Salmonella enterica subsp. enterica serovar Weltevreden]